MSKMNSPVSLVSLPEEPHRRAVMLLSCLEKSDAQQQEAIYWAMEQEARLFREIKNAEARKAAIKALDAQLIARIGG